LADVFDFANGTHQHGNAAAANCDEIGLKRALMGDGLASLA
jgi:hypothetical protein